MEAGLLLLILLLSPLLGLILWLWNEVTYVSPVRIRCSNFKLPPGNLGFPLIGEMLSFSWYFKILRRPDDFIRSKISKYGHNVGLYRTYLFGFPSIIACSPNVCKLVLQSSNKDEFVPAWPESIVGANSVVALHGARHQTIKNFLMNFINHPDSLRRVVLHIQPHIINALESWSNIGKIKAVEELRKVTLDYLRRYFINCELGIATDGFAKLLAGLNQGLRAEPWNFLGTGTHHAIQCRKKLIKILRDELEKRKQEKHTTNTISRTNDLMDELMQLKDKEGKQLSDEEALDNILLIIQLSNIGIGYAMPWCLYFLAKFPHVLLKLREENLCMSQKKNGEYIRYEDVLELQYTLKVVEEIIRMANISGFIFRRVTQDIEYKGYVIPKGWKVIVWLRYLHTDSKIFDDPMCFNPDRWDKRPTHGTFLPFGGGAKTCAGNMVARLNLAIFIHYLTIGYKWNLVNPNMAIKYLSHPQLADGLEISIGKI